MYSVVIRLSVKCFAHFVSDFAAIPNISFADVEDIYIGQFVVICAFLKIFAVDHCAIESRAP